MYICLYHSGWFSAWIIERSPIGSPMHPNQNLLALEPFSKTVIVTFSSFWSHTRILFGLFFFGFTFEFRHWTHQILTMLVIVFQELLDFLLLCKTKSIFSKLIFDFQGYLPLAFCRSKMSELGALGRLLQLPMDLSMFLSNPFSSTGRIPSPCFLARSSNSLSLRSKVESFQAKDSFGSIELLGCK